jgi:hypothetical protein
MGVRELVDWELLKTDEDNVTVVGKTPSGVNVFSSYIESYALDTDVLRVSTFNEGYVLRAEYAKNLMNVGGDFDRLVEVLRDSRINNLIETHVLGNMILRPRTG